MLDSNSSFDTYNVLPDIKPVFLLHIDGETIDYTGQFKPTSPTNTLKPYIETVNISAATVTPEEGRASVGAATVVLIDINQEFRARVSAHADFFHRAKATVKYGFLGMAESDMLQVVGYITGLKKTGANAYQIEITDPQRWLQREIFRGATTASPITVEGNPIDILLYCAMSTGAGTNGDYDILAAANGLGLTTDIINVDRIEAERDKWFAGPFYNFKFTMRAPIKAKDLFEKHILSMLACYPYVDGQGKYAIKAFKPAIPTVETVQSLTDDNLFSEVPDFDSNLNAMINEVEIHHDWDGSKYDEINRYIGDNIDTRGPGTRTLKLKSYGLHANTQPRIAEFRQRRANRIFARYDIPPVRLQASYDITRYLTEAGDICPVTHADIPDFEADTDNVTDKLFEVINRRPNMTRGAIDLTLLESGFTGGPWMVISPTATLTAVTSQTQFTVSVADAAKFEVGWEVQLYRSGYAATRGSAVTITSINTGTGVIQTDSIGATPAIGDKMCFADYASLSDATQKQYWAISDSAGALGTDTGHKILP